MRPYTRLVLAIPLALVVGCDSAKTTAPTPASPDQLSAQVSASADRGSANHGPLAFAPEAHPYGRNMIQWSEDWWKYILSIPTAKNPELDTTGVDCRVDQHGDVWYLALVGTGSVTRTCRIPHDKALLVNLSGILNDYPCPDTSFHPARGQSLQDFLTQGAIQTVDLVNGLTLTVDGREVPNLFSYRYTSPLFYFTGNTTLQTSLDGCITGRRQPGVSDGYYVMLHPLSSGSHVIVFTSSDTHNNYSSVTYKLTVGGGGDPDDGDD